MLYSPLFGFRGDHMREYVSEGAKGAILAEKKPPKFLLPEISPVLTLSSAHPSTPGRFEASSGNSDAQFEVFYILFHSLFST